MAQIQVKLLNEKAWNLLEKRGFEETTISDISKWGTLVDMINEFVSANGSDDSIQLADYSHYSFEKNKIFINASTLNSELQYKAVTTLAHEMAHALSKTKDSNISANDFARTRSTMEGEALYYDFMAWYKIYAGRVNDGKLEFLVPCWKDNEKRPDSYDLYEDFYKIIQPDSDIKDIEDIEHTMQIKFIRLGGLNKEMIPQKSEWSYVGDLTYDEMHKWEWLRRNTDLAIDYLEAFAYNYTTNKAFDYSSARNDLVGRLLHSVTIERSYDSMFDLKVLLNKAHNKNIGNNYFGTDVGETLQAEVNGSKIGEIRYEQDGRIISGNEILWGGKGNDVLKGSTVQDILLGGDGNDRLYGFGGDDRLAGNEGDDHLYGGAGNDELYGGKGDDKYYFDLQDTSTLYETIGQDNIYDSDGQGGIKFTFGKEDIRGLKGGRLIEKNDETGVCEYQDWGDSKIIYTFFPDSLGSANGKLEIRYDYYLVATINDFDKGRGSYLSLSFNENMTAESTQANNSFALKNFYNQVYLYQTNQTAAVAAASTPYGAPSELVGPVNVSVRTGDLEDVVFGSEAGEIIYLDGGHDYVVGGESCNSVYSGEGHGYIVTGNSSTGWGKAPAASFSEILGGPLRMA